MCLQIGRIDHDRRRLCAFGCEAFHHTPENTHPAPALPTIVERFVGPLFSGSIPPTQSIAIDENDPA